MAGAIPAARTTSNKHTSPASVASHVRADRNFYLGMGLAVAIVVIFGFGRTVDTALFHPPSRRPAILYIHAAMFTGWVLLFIAQAALVRARQIALHRRLGIAGFVLGSLMPSVGIATALVMTRVNIAEGQRNQERSLIFPFFDMLAFTVTFGLSMWLRRKPEYHRRLMLMATCGLTVAAFARFPHWLMPLPIWYVGVDALILTGVARDVIRMRRVHSVYRFGLPPLVLGQAVAVSIYLGRTAAWIALAHALLSGQVLDNSTRAWLWQIGVLLSGV